MTTQRRNPHLRPDIDVLAREGGSPVVPLPRPAVKDRLRIAVEDRFLILKLWEPSAMLPTGNSLITTAEILGSFCDSYSLICDATSMEFLSEDAVDFLSALQPFDPTIIMGRKAWLEDDPLSDLARRLRIKILPLRYGLPKLSFCSFPFSPGTRYWKRATRGLEDPWADNLTEVELRLVQSVSVEDDDYDADEFATYLDFVSTLPNDADSARAWLTSLEVDDVILTRRWLARRLRAAASNSLLMQYATILNNQGLTLVPYHGHAVYGVEAHSNFMLARPSVLAKKTHTLLSRQLDEFSTLISGRARETEIQKYLENHQELFWPLGYWSVMPQVILQRDDGTQLRPDFIARPFGDDWCDIIDLKLPDRAIIVGGRDRKTLAACIHELVAQLREYAAYFENPKYSKLILDHYGLKCYKPRLIGVVGRDMRGSDPEQMRRLMTAYADVRLVTFDQLVRMAKNRLLI